MKRLLGLSLALLVVAASARADQPAPLGATSPRLLVAQLYERGDAGDWAGTVRLAEPSSRSPAETQRLLRRLRVVLEQYGPLDVDDLSSAPEGDLDDGLPADRERVLPPSGERDGPGSLNMVRVATPDGPRWVIARSTLARVDVWYRAMPSRWLVERLPPAFSRPGPFGMQPWQWLAILGVLTVSLIGAVAFGRLTAAVLRILARRTATKWDDLAIVRLRGPFIFTWFLGLLRFLLPLAAFPERPFQVIKQGLRGALAATLFWAAIAAVEAARVALAQQSGDLPGRRALLGLGGRMLKMVLALIAIVVVMAQLGFSVTSLLAGIGVGGLGLALAAQKTVENVFGAFSLGVDQPFREGDSINVDGVVGTVESIGLRSTRIRTLDRTLVAIPNGKLADMKTESLTARDRFRLYAKLGLQHDAPPDGVARILTEIEAVLRAHEKADVDARARLTGLSLAGIEIEVSCSFLTTSFDEFATIRQALLLQILGIVEKGQARWSAPVVVR